METLKRPLENIYFIEENRFSGQEIGQDQSRLLYEFGGILIVRFKRESRWLEFRNEFYFVNFCKKDVLLSTVSIMCSAQEDDLFPIG